MSMSIEAPSFPALTRCPTELGPSPVLRAFRGELAGERNSRLGTTLLGFSAVPAFEMSDLFMQVIEYRLAGRGSPVKP